MVPFEILEGTEPDDEPIVVSIGTRLLPEEHAELKAAVKERIEKGGRKFVLDLSRMDLVTTPFLGLLVTLQKAIAQAGGRMVLSGPSPYTREILDLTRLSRVFEVHADLESAKRSLG